MSNKQTTALQQLIAELQEQAQTCPMSDRKFYIYCKTLAIQKLPIERKQIEDTYIQARKHSILSSEIAFTTASDYFTSTFITD